MSGICARLRAEDLELTEVTLEGATDAEAIALGAALATNKTLTSLVLNSSEFGDRGAAAFVKSERHVTRSFVTFYGVRNGSSRTRQVPRPSQPCWRQIVR